MSESLKEKGSSEEEIIDKLPSLEDIQLKNETSESPGFLESYKIHIIVAIAILAVVLYFTKDYIMEFINGSKTQQTCHQPVPSSMPSMPGVPTPVS